MEIRPSPRFWELDFIRGMAVVMMILYHLLYDINYFGVHPLDIRLGLWLVYAEVTATIFIVLVGVSLTLTASKFKDQRVPGSLFFRFFKRGLKVFFLGEFVTLATYYLIGNGFILFGVLHLIGVSIILAYPFLRLRTFNLLAGSIIILIGIYLQGLTFGFPWLVWLGFVPEDFYSLDYFPILPWFGLVLVGIYIGNSLYHDGKRIFELPDLSSYFAAKFFGKLGRNSLAIYLIHQPVIVLGLFFTGFISFKYPA